MSNKLLTEPAEKFILLVVEFSVIHKRLIVKLI